MSSSQKGASYQSFMRSNYLSSKHKSYFEVYDAYFSQFIGKKITFVEIGIFSGGSLFMWRDFFGEEARIIGIDLDGNAKKWEKYGFEIFIGDQSSELFWSNFFMEVGEVDIMLDDGGHTYEQQIVTAISSMKNIKDGGLFMVEDVHTSFMREFGYPSKFTFMEWAKSKIVDINSRFKETNLKQTFFTKNVKSIHFHESIIVFSMNKNIEHNIPMKNNGISDDAKDFRHEKSAVGFIARLIKFILFKFPFLHQYKTINKSLRAAQKLLLIITSKIYLLKLRRYFRK